MAEVVLFHHARGLTPDVIAFADELRRAGHTVHTPDLFEGRTFSTIEEGMAHAGEMGFPDGVIERGMRAIEGLPAGLVYAGFSLGVLPAQKLARTRPRARGRCCSTPVSRSRCSVPAGLRAYRCKCMGWTLIRSSSARAISTLPGSLYSRPRTGNCSSIPAISTISPTARCRPTTRTPPPCWSSGCSASSARVRQGPVRQLTGQPTGRGPAQDRAAGEKEMLTARNPSSQRLEIRRTAQLSISPE